MNRNPTILINFNAPVTLKDAFDSLCKHQNQTRTSILLALMDSYIAGHGNLQINHDTGPTIKPVNPTGISMGLKLSRLLPDKLRRAL